jgi:hypothetical protein
MSCCHGYCHHHHWCYGPPPYGPPETYEPVYRPGYGPRRRGRPGRAWPADDDDLAGYLRDLEDEIGRVRRELDELRRSRAAREG